MITSKMKARAELFPPPKPASPVESRQGLPVLYP